MRILVIITTKFVAFGGIANAFMNYYRNMDLSGITIDVVSCIDHDEGMGKEIEANGGKVFDVPAKQKTPLKYYIAINNIMKRGYDVVDVHGNSATMVGEMILAKKNSIKNRMAHCLNSKTDHPYIHKVMSKAFNSLCNNKTACTDEAGKFLYGDNSYVVLRNTIPLYKYEFSLEFRNEIRKKYNIFDDTVLIGTVGKINKQKNQAFLIPILKKIIENYSNIKFMIVGDGPLKSELEDLITENNLEKYVILAGMQSNVVAYYSAFDIYVFPSLFEGESLALLEAKSSGVLGCASSQIKTKDDDGSKNIAYVDLIEEKWIENISACIEGLKTQNRQIDSQKAISKIKDKGLDSIDAAKGLKKLYLR